MQLVGNGDKFLGHVTSGSIHNKAGAVLFIRGMNLHHTTALFERESYSAPIIKLPFEDTEWTQEDVFRMTRLHGMSAADINACVPTLLSWAHLARPDAHKDQLPEKTPAGITPPGIPLCLKEATAAQKSAAKEANKIAGGKPLTPQASVLEGVQTQAVSMLPPAEESSLASLKVQDLEDELEERRLT